MPNPRRTVVESPEVCPPLKPHYSNAVKVTAGSLLFVAGQIALDKNGKLVGKGDLRAQAVQVLENIRHLVEAAGGQMKDVLKFTVYVTDMRAFEDLADIRLRYFPKDGPASAIVEIKRLALPDLLIEIEAVAAVP